MNNLAYLTFTGAVPSRKADAVCVMKMCGALAALSFDVELILPKGQGMSLETLGYSGNIFGFYGISNPFMLSLIHI